jgi:hypothetical protein
VQLEAVEPVHVAEQMWNVYERTPYVERDVVLINHILPLWVLFSIPYVELTLS